MAIKPIYIRVEHEVSEHLPEYLAYLTADCGRTTPTSMRALLSAFRDECRYVCPLSVIEGLYWPVELSDYDRKSLVRDAREKIIQWTARM